MTQALPNIDASTNRQISAIERTAGFPVKPQIALGNHANHVASQWMLYSLGFANRSDLEIYSFVSGYLSKLADVAVSQGAGAKLNHRLFYSKLLFMGAFEVPPRRISAGT